MIFQIQWVRETCSHEAHVQFFFILFSLSNSVMSRPGIITIDEDGAQVAGDLEECRSRQHHGRGQSGCRIRILRWHPRLFTNVFKIARDTSPASFCALPSFMET
jgi:hypothetical protein